MNKRIIIVIAILFSVFLFTHIQAMSSKVNITNGDAGGRYHPIALNLERGNGFSDQRQSPFLPNDFDQPLYPFFVASIYWFGGNPRAVTIIQCILELLIILLTLKIAYEFRLSRIAMIMIAVFAAISPFLAIFANQILTEILATLALTLLCYIFVVAVKSKKYMTWIFAGLVSAICLLIRPDTIISVFLMICVAFITSIIELKRKSAVRILLCSTIFILSMLPWTIRNYTLNGKIQPLGRVPGQPKLGYIQWLNTWLTDPQDIPKFWWGRMDLKTPQTFPDAQLCCETQSRAEEYLKIAQQQNTIEGSSSGQFSELAKETYQEKPFESYILVPVKRVALTILNLPMYTKKEINQINEDEINQIYKDEFYQTNIYLIWFLFLVFAAIGFVKMSISRIFLIPISLFAGRIFLPLYSALGAEPRYIIESLPILYIIAASGFSWVYFLIQKLRKAKKLPTKTMME